MQVQEPITAGFRSNHRCAMRFYNWQALPNSTTLRYAVLQLACSRLASRKGLAWPPTKPQTMPATRVAS
eukprot:5940805-Alexandrium_andersonii.AAC.1